VRQAQRRGQLQQPAAQAGLERGRVKPGEEPLEGVVRRDAVGQGQEPLQPGAAAPAEGLDLLPGVGPGDDGADGDADDVQEAVPLPVAAARVLELAEVRLEGQAVGRGSPP
jgi:hypothetical protein